MGRTFFGSEWKVSFFEALALFFLFAFGAFVFYGYCQEERITLTTYYPAPFGIYRDLNVTRTLNMSVANATNPTNGIYFNGPTGGAMMRGFTNQLRIEIANAAANTIYMGSTTGCGVVLGNDGNVYVCADVLVHSSGPGHGCFVVTYSSFSGITACPGGYTVNLALSGVATTTGGVFFCCK